IRRVAPSPGMSWADAASGLAKIAAAETPPISIFLKMDVFMVKSPFRISYVPAKAGLSDQLEDFGPSRFARPRGAGRCEEICDGGAQRCLAHASRFTERLRDAVENDRQKHDADAASGRAANVQSAKAGENSEAEAAGADQR